MAFNAHLIYEEIISWLIEIGIPQNNIIVYERAGFHSADNIPSAVILPDSGRILPVERREHIEQSKGLLRRYEREQTISINLYSSNPDHGATLPLESLIDQFLMKIPRIAIIGTDQGKDGAREVSFMPLDSIKYRTGNKNQRDLLCVELLIKCSYFLYEDY